MFKITAALFGFAVVSLAAETPVKADYELRGFFGAGNELEVSIRNTSDGKSQWLQVGKTAGNIRIEKADAKAGSATVLIDGIRQNLRLAAAIAPEPEMPATKENLEKLMARQREILGKPGVGKRAEAHMRTVKAEYARTHPDEAALSKAILDAPDGTDAEKKTKLMEAYAKRFEEQNVALEADIRASGDADLVEVLRLGIAAKAMNEKLPQEFALGFKASYGRTTGKTDEAK